MISIPYLPVLHIQNHEHNQLNKLHRGKLVSLATKMNLYFISLAGRAQVTNLPFFRNERFMFDEMT